MSDPFSNFNDDDLAETLNAPLRDLPVHPPASYKPKTFTEDCPNCRGTGMWRPGYPCFKCRGRGSRTFKSSPEARAKGRVDAKKAAERKAARLQEMAQEFRDTYPQVMAFIRNNPDFDFAIAMNEAIHKYGTLTEKQLGAALRCAERDATRRDGREQAKAAFKAAHPDIIEWIVDNPTFDFAIAMGDALARYGSLTERQLAAAQKCADRDRAKWVDAVTPTAPATNTFDPDEEIPF